MGWGTYRWAFHSRDWHRAAVVVVAVVVGGIGTVRTCYPIADWELWMFGPAGRVRRF